MDFSPHLFFLAKIFIDFFLATEFNPEMSRILILVFVNEGYVY